MCDFLSFCIIIIIITRIIIIMTTILIMTIVKKDFPKQEDLYWEKTLFPLVTLTWFSFKLLPMFCSCYNIVTAIKIFPSRLARWSILCTYLPTNSHGKCISSEREGMKLLRFQMVIKPSASLTFVWKSVFGQNESWSSYFLKSWNSMGKNTDC